jgi:AcrR family transcriptional regulator
MKSNPKLSREERRAAIIRAVRRVFAQKGFHGTTTRELAEAAGVSEALLFKHFPDKESLYSAMQISCCAQEQGKGERLMALEPSASTLVFLVHLVFSKMLGPRPVNEDDEGDIQSRLLLRSLAEDGEFARLFLQGMPAHWVRKVEECLQAAIAAGDAVAGPLSPRLAAWFAHHVATQVLTHLLPANPTIDYGEAREQLVEQAVWFALRGMGLKEEIIKRHYNPRALALFTG